MRQFALVGVHMQKHNHEDVEELLTVEQIEAQFHAHRSTFYRHARKRGIRAYQRPGDKRSYFRRADVEELFKPRQKEGA
jgi:hypothetical protein